MFLHHNELLLLTLFHLQSFSIFKLFLKELLLCHLNAVLDVVFHILVFLSKHSFLKFLLSASLLLETCLFLVALLDAHNVFGFLFGLFYFLPSLDTKKSR